MRVLVLLCLTAVLVTGCSKSGAPGGLAPVGGSAPLPAACIRVLLQPPAASRDPWGLVIVEDGGGVIQVAGGTVTGEEKDSTSVGFPKGTFNLRQEYPDLSRSLVEVRPDAHKITFHYQGQPGSEHGLQDRQRVKELLTRARDASIKAGQWPDRLTEIWNRQPPGSG
jgi:hypothetical protein